MTRPTKDVFRAMARLERAAPHLHFLGATFGYGGSIEGDLLAVLQALERFQAAGAVDPVDDLGQKVATRDKV